MSLTVEALAQELRILSVTGKMLTPEIEAAALLPFIDRHIAAGQQGAMDDDVLEMLCRLERLAVVHRVNGSVEWKLLVEQAADMIRRLATPQPPKDSQLIEAARYGWQHASWAWPAVETGIGEKFGKASPPKPAGLCTNCAADGRCMKRQALCVANGTADAKPAGAVPLPEAVASRRPHTHQDGWVYSKPGEFEETLCRRKDAIRYGDAREAAARADAGRADAAPAAELSRLAAILDHDGDEHGVGAQLRQLARQSAAAPQQMTTQGEPETRESAMVIIKRDASGTPTVWCDPEIADLVTALNAGGIPTVASCSGHGVRAGVIMLADGRELVIVPDWEAGRRLERLTKNHARRDVEGIQPDVIVSPEAEGAGREAVAELRRGQHGRFVDMHWSVMDALPIGTKFYTHPSPVADAEAPKARPRVFIDMDGVIVDFDAYKTANGLTGDEVKRTPGAYLAMPAIPGAIEAVRSVIGMGFEVWIATKPPTGVPYAYSDKAAWVMEHLPELKRRIIVTHDKGLLGAAGDFLCDDRPHKANCERFAGTLLRFVDGYHWPQALGFLRARRLTGSQS